MSNGHASLPQAYFSRKGAQKAQIIGAVILLPKR
jgi:hypothetical protein